MKFTIKVMHLARVTIYLGANAQITLVLLNRFNVIYLWENTKTTIKTNG